MSRNLLIAGVLLMLLGWSCAHIWDPRTRAANRHLDGLWAASTADGEVDAGEAEALVKAMAEVRNATALAYQTKLEAALVAGSTGTGLGAVAFRLMQRYGIPGMMRPRRVEVVSSSDTVDSKITA